MDKKEIMAQFIDYLQLRGFDLQENKSYVKGHLSIRFVAGGKRIIVMDTNPDHKHAHVVTSLTPKDETLADILFELCELNDK